MQIEKIIIKNYKGIENFSYEPKHKIGILAGHIGLGKSTFLESIQSVVTGEMSRSNIRKGQGECMISMDVYNEGEEPVSIKRCYFIDKASQHFLKGRRGSKKNLDQYIEENIIHMPIEDFQIASSSDILT
jgi:recombinational DNA repair ATPase RecF